MDDSETGDKLVTIRMKYAEIIEELLECPVCFEIPRGNILLCAAGHNVCERCRNNLNVCPSCQKEYTGKTRNYMAESLSSNYEDIRNSILDPKHRINKIIRENIKCMTTQTDITDTCSTSVQTECQTINTETQTDSAQFSVATQTDFKTIFDLKSSLQIIINFINNKECTNKHVHKLLLNKLYQYVATNYEEHLLQATMHDKGTWIAKCIIRYDTNRSFDYFINLHKVGLYSLNISIDENGSIRGHINVLQNIFKNTKVYFLAIFTHLLNFTASRGMVIDESDFFISSEDALRVLQNTKHFEFSLTLCSADAFY